MKGKIWEVQVKQGAEKGCRRPEDQELIQGTFCSFFFFLINFSISIIYFLIVVDLHCFGYIAK